MPLSVCARNNNHATWGGAGMIHVQEILFMDAVSHAWEKGHSIKVCLYPLADIQ